ncbi:MAG: hypothetical protein IPJ04_11485 [Candidatus Eisenbacteria bacterium]|nr:hypothetical protein [Candidatus Eisenbacteria bacterium]
MAQTKPAPKPSASSGAFTLTTAWAAVVLALLTMLFFHEVSIGGRTFVSPDATNPLGFVRIGEQSLTQNHVYPLWNPFVFLGMPSFGSGAYNPWIYPPDWPLALIQKVVPMPELTWLLIYYFLGAYFMYQLAREWGARPEGALLGAVAFVFAPNLVAVGAHGHGSQLVNSAYLPLMVWLGARWMRRGSLADLGALALAGGFQFLRGHVQICFYSWIAVTMWAGVSLASAIRTPGELPARALRAVGILAAAALAFGVAGVYNLPLKDYAQYSIRGGDTAGGAGFAYATGWSLAPYEMLAAVIPNWVGFGGQTYWGGMPFTDYPNVYLGVVAVLLAIPALLGGGAPRAFAFLLGVFALLVSFGSHSALYAWMYAHVPMFNKFRIPVMIVILLQLSMALALAWGWTEVIAPDAKRKALHEKLWWVVGAVVLACGLAVLGGGEGLRTWYVTMATTLKQGFPAEAAQYAFAAFTADTQKALIAALVVIAVAMLTVRGKLNAGLASVVALVLLLGSLWPISNQVMAPVIGDPIARDNEAGRDEIVDFLEKQGPWGSFRVVYPELRDNRLAGFGVAVLGGYHAAKPQLYQDLVTPGSGVILSARLWTLCNVRYLALNQNVPAEALTQVLGPLGAFFRPVYSGAAGGVYEYARWLPRATVVDAWAVIPDTGAAAVDSVSSSMRDPATFAFLSKDPGFPSSDAAAPAGVANITKYGLHEVEIEAEASGAALVRLSDLWYPDWKATVDGKSAEILRADHALRAVVIPAGKHTVRFTFESASFRNGLTLSVICALVALALLVAGILLDRRAHPTKPSEAV